MKYAKFVFLDTAYVYALINTHDKWHERAVAWQEQLAKERKPLLLTEFILVEIVSLSSELFEEAFKLYKKRADKGWGLTDCTSFIVMKRYGIMDALTTDEHFQQAGFRALLREDAIIDGR